MPTTEKKFFVFPHCTYALVKATDRWYIEYYQPINPAIPEKKRRYKVYKQINRIKDLKAREVAAIGVINELAAIDKSDDTDQKSPLQKALEIAKIDLRKKSYQTYASKIKIFQEWLGKKRKSECTVNKDDLTEFFQHLRIERKLQQTSVAGYKRVLNAIYNKSDLSNPVTGIVVKKGKHTSKMYFTDQQCRQIICDAAQHDPQVLMAIELLYYCYVRPGEQRLLRLYAFHLDLGFIEIDKTISKNGKTERVTIPEPLLTNLRDSVIFRKYPSHYYLFSINGEPGPKPLSENMLNHKHAQCLKRLKIVGNYSLYSWKHTSVVRVWKSGKIDLKELQMQLRHSSLDMVNEYLKNLGVLNSTRLRSSFPALIEISNYASAQPDLSM